MTNDRYLNSVLTVIALCLLYLCWTSPFQAVRAQADFQKVVIVGVGQNVGSVPVTITGVAQNAPVPVTIMNQTPIPVRQH